MRPSTIDRSTPAYERRARSITDADWARPPSMSLQGIQVVAQAEVLPPLQRHRDVAVLPEEVVEVAQAKSVGPHAACVRQEPGDLQFADQVADGEARLRRVARGFITGRALVHGYGRAQILGSLIDG